MIEHYFLAVFTDWHVAAFTSVCTSLCFDVRHIFKCCSLFRSRLTNGNISSVTILFALICVADKCSGTD